MRIALRAAANGKLVCAENAGDQPLIANRDAVGQWEEFDVLTQDEHGNWVPLEPPAPQPQPVKPPIIVVPLPPHEQFMKWVDGKPFGQQTLLDLEPTMNAAGWLLTPPNAVGDRTKVHPIGGAWTRVGFGEGHWVWIEESDK